MSSLNLSAPVFPSRKRRISGFTGTMTSGTASPSRSYTCERIPIRNLRGYAIYRARVVAPFVEGAAVIDREDVAADVQYDRGPSRSVHVRDHRYADRNGAQQRERPEQAAVGFCKRQAIGPPPPLPFPSNRATSMSGVLVEIHDARSRNLPGDPPRSAVSFHLMLPVVVLNTAPPKSTTLSPLPSSRSATTAGSGYRCRKS